MFYAHVYTCIQLNVYFRFYIIKTSIFGLTELGLLGKWITNSLKNEGFLTSFKSLKYFSYLKSILTLKKSNFSSSVMMNHTWSFWTIFFHLYRSLEMCLTIYFICIPSSVFVFEATPSAARGALPPTQHPSPSLCFSRLHHYQDHSLLQVRPPRGRSLHLSFPPKCSYSKMTDSSISFAPNHGLFSACFIDFFHYYLFTFFCSFPTC